MHGGSVKNGNGTNGTGETPPLASRGEAALANPLSERLRSLEGRVPPNEISDLWVFPPLSDLEDSREFVLFTRRLPDEMRRVCAAEFPAASGGVDAGGNGHATGNGRGANVRITEYGRVPSGRVSRVVEGFRRRLGDDREPLHLRIEGRPDSWDRLLAPQSPVR
jgi:hypothetical protein